MNWWPCFDFHVFRQIVAIVWTNLRELLPIKNSYLLKLFIRRFEKFMVGCHHNKASDCKFSENFIDNFLSYELFCAATVASLRNRFILIKLKFREDINR